MSPRASAFSLAAFVLILDRITKLLAEAYLAPADTIRVIPGFFNLILTENRGIAFGVFSENESEWRTFFLSGITLLIMALVTVMLWQRSPTGMAASRLSRYGLAMVLGGAAGNLYDRMLKGAVTDFLDFHLGAYHWPAFNVADSAITIGVGLVLLDLWRSHRKVRLL
ncbi:MAG: signal peptidase II [Bryobacteraceae bacterium]